MHDWVLPAGFWSKHWTPAVEQWSTCQRSSRFSVSKQVRLLLRQSTYFLFSFTICGNRLIFALFVHSTEDIDESSAEGLCDAKSYAKANPMLIQVPVLGTRRKFWRLSDNATRISWKLALILRSQHSVGKCLTAPLQVSNVWIGSTGSVKLRGASFSGKGFSIERVRDDYRNLSKVLQALIRMSGGDVAKLPPDYRAFLALLGDDNLMMEDEFLIVNNAALLPMKNR